MNVSFFGFLFSRNCFVIAQVKDNSAYQAVASNTSGTTPKELFEDVVEELVKQVLWSGEWSKKCIRVCL